MNRTNEKMFGWKAGMIIGVCAALVFSGLVVNTNQKMIEDFEDDLLDDGYEMTWHEVRRYDFDSLGEATPGTDDCEFLSIFLLDYGQDPDTVLANNATDWENDANVHGYADADEFSEDAKANDPFYIVVRAQFSRNVYEDGQFYGDRCRCDLTVAGDESFTTSIWGNDTAETYGGGIESRNETNEGKIYINFYFDDDNDGYRILSDGSITIGDGDLVLYEKY